MNDQSQLERLDRATSAPLAKLATRLVDTSRLERRLEQALREETLGETPEPRFSWRGWRSLTSAAAAAIVIFIIGWLVLDAGTTPAIATPDALAQVHYDIAHGLAPHLKVSSVDEANQLLRDQSNGVVPIPELPGIMMSCCLRQHANATLTCALIDRDGQLITVAVADGAKLHSPKGNTIVHHGRQFIVHTANGINMVMARQGDRWLCVMGEAEPDQLLQVAVEIRF